MRNEPHLSDTRFDVGQILLLSSGEPSDYGVYGVYLVQKPLDNATLLTFQRLQDGQDYWPLAFVQYLVHEGFLSALSYQELYLGYYRQSIWEVRAGET